MTALLVALGGALGATARYVLDVTAPRRRGVPWGVLAANVVGSLLLGALVGGTHDPAVRALLATGFCGALTTYSTFAADAVRLWQRGARVTAAAYALGSLTLGLGAFGVGQAAASSLG